MPSVHMKFHRYSRGLKVTISALVGALLGYWLLPFLAPTPLSYDLAWVNSGLTHVVGGMLIGVIVGQLPQLQSPIRIVLIAAGLLVTQIVAWLLAAALNVVWYDILQLEHPWSAFLFLDIAQLLLWIVLSFVLLLVFLRLSGRRLRS